MSRKTTKQGGVMPGTNHQTQKIAVEETKKTLFMEGFNKALPAIDWFFKLSLFIGGVVYFLGGFQTSQVSTIQILKDSQKVLEFQIEKSNEASAAKFAEIKRDMPSKSELESINTQLRLLREENRETRELLMRVVENRNK